MSYVYVKVSDKAHQKLLNFLETLDGADGFQSYISCHNKDEFIKSVAEDLK